MLDDASARAAVVAAADRLFYARGVQSVGMDAVRAEAGVSLKRIYSLFPSKDDLVVAVLRHRTEQWDAGIARAAAGATTPRGRLLAVFDFLDAWFREDGFRGCAFINSFGEQHDLERAVVGQTRLAHDAARVPLERLLVLAHGRGHGGRRRTELTERVDERAPTEPVLAEPRVEEVEHGEQPAPGRGRSGRGARDPRVPLLGAVPQHGDDEVVLGREQRVDALERHPGLGADRVHPHGLDALREEQPVGGGHDRRACAHVVEHRHLLFTSRHLR